MSGIILLIFLVVFDVQAAGNLNISQAQQDDVQSVIAVA